MVNPGTRRAISDSWAFGRNWLTRKETRGLKGRTQRGQTQTFNLFRCGAWAQAAAHREFPRAVSAGPITKWQPRVPEPGDEPTPPCPARSSYWTCPRPPAPQRLPHALAPAAGHGPVSAPAWSRAAVPSTSAAPAPRRARPSSPVPGGGRRRRR